MMKMAALSCETWNVRGICRGFFVKSGFMFAYLLLFLILSPSFASAQSGSDLRILSMDIISGEQVHNNEYIRVKVVVLNSGSESAKGFRVDLFKNGTTTTVSGKRGDLSLYVRSLEAGKSIPVDFIFKVYSGQYNFVAVADPDQLLTESNENNNIFSTSTLTVAGNLQDDSKEENDSLSAAKELSGNDASYSLVAADDDYFYVKADSGEYISLDMVYESSISAVNLYLVDSNGNVLQSSESRSGKEHIHYKANSSGRFYIKVVNSGISNSYSLTVNVGSLPDFTVSIKEIELGDPVTVMEVVDGEEKNVTRYDVTFTVEIINQGVSTDASVYVDIFRDQTVPPQMGDEGNKTRLVTSSEFENKRAEVEIKDHITYSDGDYSGGGVVKGQYIAYALVNSDRRVKEASEENNISSAKRFDAGVTEFHDDSREENDLHPARVSSGSRQQYIDKITIPASTHVLNNLVAKDADFFAFTVKSGGYMRISIDFVDRLGDLDLFLYTLDNDSSPILRAQTREDQEVLFYRNSSAADVTLIAKVDPKEINLNYDLHLDNYSQTPNTDLQILNFSYPSGTPSQGDTFNFTLSVRNNGTVPAENVRVDLFLKGDGDAAPQLGDTSHLNQTIPLLNASESKTLSFPVVLAAGESKFYAIVDSLQHIAESSESNNIVGPYTVTTGSGEPDDIYESRNSAENDSLAQAIPLALSTYANLKAFDEDWYAAGVNPGKTLAARVLFYPELGDLDAGFYRKADDGTPIPVGTLERSANGIELRYTNRGSAAETIYLMVRPAGDANGYLLTLAEGSASVSTGDLVISSMVTLPVDGKEGDLFRTTVEIRNVSQHTVSGDLYVDLYTSGTSAPAASSYGDLFDLIPAVTLAPNEKTYLTFEYYLSRGDYTLYAAVDVDNRIPELNESNNAFGPQNIKVGSTVAANLLMENLSVNSGSGKLSANFKLANRGSVGSSAFQIQFFLSDADSGRLIYEWAPVNVAALTAGQERQYSDVELFLDSYVPDGSYQLHAFVDWDNRVTEQNEGDNLSSSSDLTVSGQGRPYLIESFRSLLYSETAVSTVIELYKDNGDDDPELIRSSAGGFQQFGGLLVHLPLGKYFVRIYGFNENVGNYSFYITKGANSRSGTEDVNAKSPDSYEKNNNKDQAKLFDLSSPQVQDQSIFSADDEDWIYFNVE